MQEHENWLAALLNHTLAGPANAILDAARIGHEPAHPWSNWMAMELLVALLIVVVFALLRAGLSMDRPGKLQHIFEAIYFFLRDQTTETIEHHGDRYVSFFGTIFIFILFMNLIGVIPGFESPTMFPMVPAGCAIAVFLYYNWMGLRELGPAKYFAQFLGPMPAIAILMFPIEIISHLARPLSLTIRLFANMFAGEKVTLAFMALVPVVIPALFMGLHVFVSFLQAYIFALMAMIYVGTAVSHEH
jgi:F-type H+-transporting ATPase subunit a